jgi:methionyl-tRNA formyltransferase
VKIAFLGTPPFAVASLDALVAAGHQVVAVVAQPDRPAGRNLELKEPATKVWARARGVPVMQPEKVRDGALAAGLGALSPDALVVAAYGRILGRDLLDLTPHGAINVHGSLLPKYRGAAPIQWALAEGERETGITIMQMDEGLDTGDILLQRALAIAPNDDGERLHDKLAALGGSALVEALALLAAGKLVPVRQDGSRATLAPILQREHGRLDFTLPAARLAARVRAFNPWPGTFTMWGERLLKVHAASAEPLALPAGPPGTVHPLPSRGLGVRCGEGELLLTELQLEGKRRQNGAAFLQGSRVEAGAVLG